jgi:hypothetical protein
MNLLVPFALAFAAIVIGVKGFTRTGLPLTSKRNITGRAARVIGTICLILGLGFVGVGVWLWLPVLKSR